MEVLGYPVGSPLDNNLYKVIKLPNDIRVLLIVERQVLPGDERWFASDSCMEVAIAEFNRLFGSNYRFHCDCHQNERLPSAQHEFGHGKMASVAWSVGVGSLSDPDVAPGLAHLFQRMFTLRTTGHQKRNDFQMFITENDGEFKAVTEGECTKFSFKIPNELLEEALNRFAQFFVNPAMNIKDIQLERNIIDLEFRKVKMDDEARRLRLLQTIGTMGHPMTRFYYGNKMTLRRRDKNDETMYRWLEDFRKFYYGAEHMTIAIKTGFGMEEIEAIVGRTCGVVRKNNIPRSNFANKPFPFRTREFRALYKVKPVKDETSLFITWEIETMPPFSYKTKSIEYISRLLVHADCGGLASYLLYRVWITNIDAGPGPHWLESNDCCTLFTMKLSLTEEGLNNYTKILEVTFMYLKYLRTVEPCAWLFKEFQDLKNVEFHMKNNPEMGEDICTLAKRIRADDPAMILQMGTLVAEWSPEEVMSYLKMLRPQKANFMLMSRTFNFKGCCKKEKYFGIKYTMEALPEAFIKKLQRIRVAKSLNFEPPSENNYLARNFCKFQKILGTPDIDDPVCVLQSGRFEFWNLLEHRPGGIPEATYRFSLCTNIQNCFISKAALLDLWVQILRSNVVRQVQSGTEAGLYFQVEPSHLGIEMEFGGFIENLDIFIAEIFDRVARINIETNEASFEWNRKVQLRNYYEEISTPALLATRLKDFIVTNTTYMPQELYEALKEVTFEEFHDFCKEFSETISIVGLAEGNQDSYTANMVGSSIRQQLDMGQIASPYYTNVQVRELPLGDTVVRIPSFTDKADKHIDANISAVANVYQIGTKAMRDLVITHIVARLLYEPAVEYLLRVKEIGHALYIDWSFNASSLEFHIGILSNSKKFTASEVKKEIDYFVESAYDTSIRVMSEHDFDEMRKMEGWDKSGYFETNNWREIITGDLMFDRSEKMENIAYGLSLQEIKRFYESYLLPRSEMIRVNLSRMRKLSVQVVGPADKEYSVKIDQFPPIDVFRPRYQFRDPATGERCRRKLNKSRKSRRYPFVSLVPEEPPPPEGEIPEICEKEKTKNEKFQKFNRIIKDFNIFKRNTSFIQQNSNPRKIFF